MKEGSILPGILDSKLVNTINELNEYGSSFAIFLGSIMT